MWLLCLPRNPPPLPDPHPTPLTPLPATRRVGNLTVCAASLSWFAPRAPSYPTLQSRPAAASQRTPLPPPLPPILPSPPHPFPYPYPVLRRPHPPRQKSASYADRELLGSLALHGVSGGKHEDPMQTLGVFHRRGCCLCCCFRIDHDCWGAVDSCCWNCCCCC